jgi:hypothetical protein
MPHSHCKGRTALQPNICILVTGSKKRLFVVVLLLAVLELELNSSYF